MYTFSFCHHSSFLDCILWNFISNNFKRLYPEKNIFSCPIWNEGKLSFESNQDLINAFKKSIENKNENNRQPSENSQKGKCAKHKINVENYCPSCKKWLCSQCKKIYHDEYFP